MRILRGIAIIIAALLGGTAAQADSVVVTHWGSAFYGTPYAVAMEKGFFKQHGIDMTGITSGSGGGTSVRNTLAGDLPFGEVALSAAVLAIQHGEPLVLVCGGNNADIYSNRAGTSKALKFLFLENAKQFRLQFER